MAEKAVPKQEAPAEEYPYGKGKRAAAKPVVGPDGHVHLSEEDIEARDANS